VREAGPARRVYDSIADLIPDLHQPSPLVRLSERVHPNRDFPIYLKLEGMNPFGSIKDRPARRMIEGARLGPGQALVEPSSGNTGIALAALANARGVPIEIAVPERVPEEKKLVLRLLGVKLWEASDDLCPLFPTEGARGLVKSMVESPAFEGRYVSPNQYENELNVLAHYESTGPEIWDQTEGRLDHFFAGFGTCGTITGVGRYLKERNPAIKIVGVEPADTEHHLPGMKRITGLTEELTPKILDRSVIDEVVTVGDEVAYRTGIELARRDGILVGPTTGALVSVALRAAAEGQGLAVVVAPDDAFKYLSAYAEYLEDDED
jgi:cysteine synthase A/cysteine synthase B